MASKKISKREVMWIAIEDMISDKKELLRFTDYVRVNPKKFVKKYINFNTLENNGNF